MKSARIPNLIAAPVLACAFLLAFPAAAYSQAPTTEPARSISELAWIAGDWQTAPGGRAQMEEHWTQPAGGTMIGMGRTLAGGKTVGFEFLRLEQRADGIYYVAHPNARAPGTDFKLSRLAAQEAIFENPRHDFPKRILYRKNSDGSLTASIDAGAGAKSQSFPYLPMKK
jgi:Domain of unknown function (DUF6265)